MRERERERERERREKGYNAGAWGTFSDCAVSDCADRFTFLKVKEKERERETGDWKMMWREGGVGGGGGRHIHTKT